MTQPPVGAVVWVGDRIRFSVALLQQIDAEPEHASVVCIVESIQSEADWTKTIMLVPSASGMTYE
jgi:hypothetical protein